MKKILEIGLVLFLLVGCSSENKEVIICTGDDGEMFLSYEATFNGSKMEELVYKTRASLGSEELAKIANEHYQEKVIPYLDEGQSVTSEYNLNVHTVVATFDLNVISDETLKNNNMYYYAKMSQEQFLYSFEDVLLCE